MIKKGMISSNMLLNTWKGPIETPGASLPCTKLVFPVGDALSVKGPMPRSLSAGALLSGPETAWLAEVLRICPLTAATHSTPE
ncbi:MAG: hypothetical protein FJ189_02565 [Gammaproteobacteria bacterium]|nr:hypothetical protein [Gammaproteobacteria bacterium]